MVISADDVKKLGTILGIWAHPDDETRCLGGIMSLAAKNDQRVACITATCGEAGQTASEEKWPRIELGSIRKTELKQALTILGVKEYYWLNLKDGMLNKANRHDVAGKISSLIKEINPDTIFSFGPDGFTGHPDHQTMYYLTKEAIKLAESKASFYRVIELKENHGSHISQQCHELFNLFYPSVETEPVDIENADLCLQLSIDVKKQKLLALRRHQSQYAHMFAHPIGKKYFEENDGIEAFIKVAV